MLDGKTLIKATNRSGGSVGYKIPDLNNLKRHYAAGETKEVTMEELRKLSYVDGGRELLKDYLVIDNKEAINELLGNVEPEYFYTTEQIKDLLLNGSLDALKDCLDFAPEGTIDEVKKLAVELKLPDFYKREAIQKATGLNVTRAIAEAEADKDAADEPKTGIRRLDAKDEKVEAKPAQRRVAATTTSKYSTLNK